MTDLKLGLQNNLHSRYKQIETKYHHLQYLFLEITKKCNLKCRHCGSDCKRETGIPELTTESWLKIIEYIKKEFSENVAFIITGGEPLMHPGLFEIGSFIHKSGMRWGMVTNGMLLNNSTLINLEKAGIHSITISLDGTERTHNWLRSHPSTYKRTIDALRIIANSAIHFKDVVTCVSPQNLHELDEIAEILIEKGITEWRLFRIFPSGRANGDNQLSLSFEQTNKMLQWIARNKKQLKQKGLNLNLSCEGWVPFKLDKQIRDYPFFCRSGINIASILADGTITGCSNNSAGFHVGNILKDNFKYLWENAFDIFREKQWLKDTVCSECQYFKSCRGGSIHLWEMGDDKPKFCYAKDLSKD